MEWTPSGIPEGNPEAAQPRFLDLQRSKDEADVLLCGIPFDGAVIGRKGCREGPQGIREAFRWSGTDGLDAGPLTTTWHDVGDLNPSGATTDVHERTRAALKPLFETQKHVIVLGGDNSLSYPVAQALADAKQAGEGTIGLVVIDAHYDLRSYEGEPTSGTPFRRVLEEMEPAAVAPQNLIEIGIRPYANSAALGEYAQEKGVQIIARDAVREMGGEKLAYEVMAKLANVDHIWFSVDIDAFDQSIASGCSAPSPDGLLLHEMAPLLAALASDERTAGMEIMETAPGLDQSGNTCRTAASLVTQWMAHCKK